ncbi:hypothetical protein Tco_1450137 [Tanacetum coccineum]
MFTTIKVVTRHEDTQLYGAILPDELTNEAIKDSESYKEYYVIALGAEPPKTKASVKKKQTVSDKTKTPPTAKGKRLKTSGKAAKPAKKKQPTKTSKAKGLTKSIDEEDDDEVAMSGDDDDDADNQDDDNDQNDDNTNNENDDDDGQDHEGPYDDNEQTDSNSDGDDFVHPKFSTHGEEDNEEEGLDLRVQTPSHYESTDDEESNEVTHGANVEGEELDEEETNEEDEANELYSDVNVNLVGKDTEMTDAPRTIIQTTQVIEDTHVIITPVNPEGQQQSSSVSSGFVSNMLNPSPDTGIDSIFNLNTESTSLVDVSVTTIVETPLSSATTLPPPTIPLITHLQQTPIPTPTTVPSSSLQDLPNFGSLFGFDHRLKTLENYFSEFKQTNQFAAAVSSILGIVDAYLANKMHEAVKTADQVKEHVKTQVSKILPKIEKIVNEQLEAKVLTRSSNKSKTSHAVAANLYELELKKILIDNMESNKSIHRSDEQKNLYKALVDAYESDKLILDTYGDTVSFKRRQDDDKDEEPSAGLNQGSKRRRAGKEPESTSAPKEKTSKTTGKSTEGSKSHHKSALITSLLTSLVKQRIQSTLPKIGSCKSLVELEYFFEEVYKATTDQLDWNNPKGQQYPHDLCKPLPLIPNSQGCQVIPFDHFINNDLAYLSGGVLSRTYTTLVTKTKAADYGHIK